MATSLAASVLAPVGRVPNGRSARALPEAGLSQRASSAASGSAAVPFAQRRSSRAVSARGSAVTRATIAKPSPSTSASSGGDKGGFPRGSSWEIHKFGGTCVGSAERIKNAAKLMLELPANKMVVVSAMGTPGGGIPKVTDMLLSIISKAADRNEAYVKEVDALHQKHVDTAKQILSGPLLDEFLKGLNDDITSLKSLLAAICIAGISPGAFGDFVVGHGELWCARLFTAVLRSLGNDAKFMDTRKVLTVVDASDGGVDVVYDTSNARLDAWHAENKPSASSVIVATGFIAETPDGVPTTLRRNGSDYSATIMGALTHSGVITIWTDVDGVYSADPRKVPEAVCLEMLSYNEAWELSYFGANVLHPRTTLPAMKYSIPIYIRNFFNLGAKGTRISDVVDVPVPRGAGMQGAQAQGLVKGFATIENVTLINVEGTGMVGVPGTASNIFATVRDAGVNVIMISQASSEHSICFACKADQADKAVEALERRFKDAISAGRISRVFAVENCAILAAVGQQMASTHGVCAMLFEALAKAAINVRAIAQGCSEYNITAVIDGRDTARALRAVHARFYLSETTIGVGIVGPGLIGKTLMAQFHQQLPVLHSEFNIDMRVLGVADSKKMVYDEAGVPLDAWEEAFAASKTPADLSAFAKRLKESAYPNLCIIDCSASDKVASFYEEWMRMGIHVITPNKKANSGPYGYYSRLREIGRKSYTHYFYEATVGAGLPIISTLQSLRDSGDKVKSIEGIFSGTLSYIFNTWKPGQKFSEVVAEAKKLGYTEPDPRDDLSGLDVARKVVILARESGLSLELSDVPVESLVPEALRSVPSSEEYMRRLPEFDEEMGKKIAEAEAAGEVLRYVGIVDPVGGSKVVLRRYPKAHPFASLSGSDNMMSFKTSRYSTQPLIVRGPGAGAEVTAGGVFADLLRLAAYLGAPS